MIDLKGNPFYLSDEDMKWVNEIISNMTLEEKVGQLFCPAGFTSKQSALKELVEDIKIGGIMYRPGPGVKTQSTHRFLQENSKIPLLIAANLEAGGNGIAEDGTEFGSQMQVAATDDEEMAYRLGLVAGKEGRAVGCNWAFAPVIDIDMNYRNPITNTRTYGSEPDRVLKMGKQFMKGIQESGLAVSIKHFPGDGVDERDQHLHTSINSLSCEEWDETYGKIYKGLIDNGARTLMAAHIMQPAYSRKFRSGIKDEELKPATLAPELLNDLLRDQLGFNGLIVTDSTIMAGFTVAEKRENAVPGAIAAGCDMFLFNKSIREDYEYMMQGIKKGILTKERIDEAVTRILATKASLGLNKQKKEGKLVPKESALDTLACPQHRKWAEECADQSVTLVKDKNKLLPISPDKQKRILFFVVGDEPEIFEQMLGPAGKVLTAVKKITNKGKITGKIIGQSHHKMIELLEKEGFEVTKFDCSNMMKVMKEMGKTVKQFKEEYDLAIYYTNLKTASNQTVVRVNWAPPIGADMPWFTAEIPTMFVSVSNPYHMQDVPQIPTFINGYTTSEFVLEAIVKKMVGKSEFKGISPINPYCGLWEGKM